MSKDIGSSRITRSAADASMLTEIRRRAVESQNYAAQRFLKPLFTAPSAGTLASGNSAILAQARAGNPGYTGGTTNLSGGGGGGGGGGGLGALGNVALSFGSRVFGDLVSAAVDSSGNFYALVWWGDTTNKTPINQYDGLSGGVVAQSVWGLLPVQSGNNIAIIKYTSAGVPVWVTTVSAGSGAYPLSLRVDAGGNVYVYSYFFGTVTFQNYTSGGGGGTDIVLTTAATAGPSDANDPLLMKYSSSGVFQWCATVTSTGSTNELPTASVSLALDSAGNSYFTFATQNNTTTLTFKSFSSISGGVVSFSTFGTDTLSQGYRAFVVGVDTNGAIRWVSRITRQNPATGSILSFGVATNPAGSRVTATFSVGSAGFGVESFVSAGSPITYGTKQTIVAGQAGSEAYIVGFDFFGTALWVSRMNSASAGSSVLSPVAMDGDGNVYVGGYYTQLTTVASALSIGGGSITVSGYGTLSYANGFNGCVVKYNPSGICLGATAMTLSTSNFTNVPALTCDVSGNVYAGYDCGSTVVNSVSINSFGGAVGDGTPISLSLYGTTESVKSSDALLIKYNPSLAVQWVARVETGSVGTGTENARTIAAHPTSNYVFFGGLFSNLSTAPLKIYSASGVSGNVIQYTQSATLSGNQTGATNVRQGFLVKYT